MKNLKEKKASQIFEIIRKLNKDEKRAFKLYATTYERKGNTVIALFDIIYEYTHRLPADIAPNEKDIQTQIQKEDLSAQYVSVKNRLKSMLFDFLYDRNSKDDDAEILHRKLCVANLLLNKGHLETGIQMLQESKRTAIDYEDYETWLSCIQVEMYTLSNNGTYTADIQQALLVEMKEVLGKIEKLAEAIFDANAVRESQLKRKPLPDSLPTKEMLKKMIDEETSVKIKNQYYLTLASISLRLDPPEVTSEYVAASIKMLEDNIKPNVHYIMRYFVAFGPYMPVLLSLGRTEAYQEQMRKIEAKYAFYRQYLTPATDIFVLLNIYKFKLSYYRYLGSIEAAAAVVLEAEESFTSHYRMITEEGIILYTALLRNSFFYGRNYVKAEEWATKDIGQMVMPMPVVLAGYIIELLSSYELGYGMDLVRAKIKKIKYFMSSKISDVKIIDFMDKLIDMVISLINARNTEEGKYVIKRLKEMYDATRQDPDATISLIIRTSFMQYWLESKS